MEKFQDLGSDPFLEELEVFRWRLYIAKNESASEKANLFEEACSKQISELFIEECLIAGCDMNMLSNESKLKVKKLMRDDPVHKGELLPSIQRDDDKFWDFSRLRMCLLYGNEQLFIKGLNLIARKNPPKVKDIMGNASDLFNIAASNHLTMIIKTLVTFGGQVEYSAFLSACKSGSWQSLETLMPHLDITDNKMPLLRELFSAARGADEKHRENFEKCYDLLLCDSSFNVNSMDSSGRSALYYVRNLPKKIDEFLRWGTYIGMQNGSPTPNVSFIAPAALEEHFNNCVNFVQSEDNKKVTYIEFDYKNLIAPRHGNGNIVMPNEMTAIQFISQSVDYRHLLVHPLIWSFISLKWRQLKLIRYIDCALYVLFALSNMCYILAIYGKAPTAITEIFFLLTGNMTFYVAIRRITHLLFCSNEYRRSTINYFHCYQTFQVIVSVTLVHYLEDVNRVIPAMCVLLITCELFVLAGSIFWTFSLYYIMFLSIAWSSIKSLMIYFLLLPSFIISYYLMITNTSNDENVYKNQFFDFMQKSLSTDVENVDDTQLEHFKKNFFALIRKYTDDDGDISNPDHGVVYVLMKAIIGWHRDVDEKIADTEWSSLGFIIVLISLVSILFMNLVNSLAVTGTQVIQSQSELTCLTQRCNLLAQYEEALTNRKHWFWQTFQNTRVMRLFDLCAQFDILESVRVNDERKMYIGPNDEIINHINIQSQNKSQSQSSKNGDIGFVLQILFSQKSGSQVGASSDENEKDSSSSLWTKIAALFYDKTERMNPQIVLNARNIIDRRKDDQKEKLDVNTCIRRIELLENAMLTMTNLSRKLDAMVKYNN